MSTSVIQKYVNTYEMALHNREESLDDLWVTENELKELVYLESVAMQAIERRLISNVRWHREQGMSEKLDLYTRLLAQLRGGKFHPYKLALNYITLTNV